MPAGQAGGHHSQAIEQSQCEASIAGKSAFKLCRKRPGYWWSAVYISGRGAISAMPEQIFLLEDWTYVGQNGVVGR